MLNFGDAKSYGSIRSHPKAPIMGIVRTPSGRGYWLVTRAGGVVAFGDAHNYGSMGGKRLPAPITALTATPSGRGYWLIGRSGRVYPFGDATLYTSAGHPTTQPIIAAASSHRT